MSTSRLEAFSDGVMAIVITILVLSLVPPEGDQLNDLLGVGHKLMIYLYSFLIVAVYWNNHHHLFQFTKSVNGKALWANNFFLFSLTLLPFATAWISEHVFSLYPQLLYGVIILMADVAFFLILLTLHQVNEQNLDPKDYQKSIFSMFINLIALIFGWLIAPILVTIINFLIVLLWIVPSKRIERSLLGE